MLTKTRAIVLHSIKYGETSLIVDCFTGEWGRKSFLMKGIRKSVKHNRANLFQPLFLLDLDVYFKESRELQWIKEATFPEAPPTFPGDVRKSTQAIFLAEVLKKTLHHEEKDPGLFSFLASSIEVFEHSAEGFASFHLLFMFRLTRYLGFYPGRRNGQGDLFFHPEAGGFSEFPGGREIETEKELGRLWNACSNLDYSSVDQVFTNHHQRNIFLDSLLAYYRFHIENFGELRSLEIIRSVFHQD
jgi:DNA repair protein RecO (recombination protein O)